MKDESDNNVYSGGSGRTPNDAIVVPGTHLEYEYINKVCGIKD